MTTDWGYAFIMCCCRPLVCVSKKEIAIDPSFLPVSFVGGAASAERPRQPLPPWGSQGLPRPAKRYNFSSVSKVCPRIILCMEMPQMAPQCGIQVTSWPDSWAAQLASQCKRVQLYFQLFWNAWPYLYGWAQPPNERNSLQKLVFTILSLQFCKKWNVSFILKWNVDWLVTIRKKRVLLSNSAVFTTTFRLSDLEELTFFPAASH